MRFYHLAGAKTPRLLREMRESKVSETGAAIMAPKGQTLVFKVCDLKNAAALILKQECLAKGGEAALAEDALRLGAEQPQTALLLATPAQYRRICAGLSRQAFGLPALAEGLLAALAALEAAVPPLAYRARYLQGELDFSRPLLMGIVNRTPDSFYDGGRYWEPAAAAEHVFALAEAGADIIDLGGASSRPGHTQVSVEEELARLLPVLELVAPSLQTPISVDTQQAEVARAALEAGAAILNDTGGLPAEMAALAATSGTPIVLMHQGGGGGRLVEQVTDFFRAGMERGQAAGIRREQFILDPGFGFGKEAAENLLLLRHLADLQVLNRPLLVGISNKRFIGAATGSALHEREAANLAASAWALGQGASILRSHEVKELRQAALMIEAIRNG